jgi:hypothetical protein
MLSSSWQVYRLQDADPRFGAAIPSSVDPPYRLVWDAIGRMRAGVYATIRP